MINSTLAGDLFLLWQSPDSGGATIGALLCVGVVFLICYLAQRSIKQKRQADIQQVMEESDKQEIVRQWEQGFAKGFQKSLDAYTHKEIAEAQARGEQLTPDQKKELQAKAEQLRDTVISEYKKGVQSALDDDSNKKKS